MRPSSRAWGAAMLPTAPHVKRARMIAVDRFPKGWCEGSIGFMDRYVPRLKAFAGLLAQGPGVADLDEPATNSLSAFAIPHLPHQGTVRGARTAGMAARSGSLRVTPRLVSRLCHLCGRRTPPSNRIASPYRFQLGPCRPPTIGAGLPSCARFWHI